MHCEDCKWWDNTGEIKVDDLELGYCRRYPPVIVDYQVDTNIKDWEGRMRGLFPLTEKDIDWCGEFQPKEKK